MGIKVNISHDEVIDNIKRLQEFMVKNNLDAFYVSSFDEYISEYVPMNNCPRFFLTAFSGSVAEVLVVKGKKVRLYVDGRYHEQVDSEVPLSHIEVVKVPQSSSNMIELLKDLEEFTAKNVGIEPSRTTLSYARKMESISKIESFPSVYSDIGVELYLEGSDFNISEVDETITGRSVTEKIKDLGLKSNEAYFVPALDQVAWMTNGRGYHVPFISAFLGKVVVTSKKVFCFLPKKVQKPETGFNGVKFESNQNFISVLSELKSNGVERISSSFNGLTMEDYSTLSSVFGSKAVQNIEKGLVPWMAIKNQSELRHFKESFERSDQAIFNTLQWLRSSVKSGQKITEKDFYDQGTVEYKKVGATGHSFNTIAGVGANSSIIHYGSSSEDVEVKGDQLALMDSGGYYEGGYATDCTRTIWVSGEAADQESKKMYTAVLKGVLSASNAVLPLGTLGASMDTLARNEVIKCGYDYAHGTGHGVGINVHESCAGFSPRAAFPILPGQVISMEPGVYIPGKGGVRIENILIVKEHPSKKNYVYFESLVHIGYDKSLIDESMLSFEQKKWLNEYEEKCKAKGRSF